DAGAGLVSLAWPARAPRPRRRAPAPLVELGVDESVLLVLGARAPRARLPAGTHRTRVLRREQVARGEHGPLAARVAALAADEDPEPRDRADREHAPLQRVGQVRPGVGVGLRQRLEALRGRGLLAAELPVGPHRP